MAFDELIDLEVIAKALEASPHYRVLRKLAPRLPVLGIADEETKLGLYVDTEATGLDTTRDEIIELAMVPFRFTPDGTVIRVLPAFNRLREPSIPISAEITEITGITNEMVAGCAIDPNEVIAFTRDADLIVAHNAAYDRKMLERFAPEAFEHKCWACSMSEVPWREQGFEGTKLGYLATQFGFFYDKHRAVSDCLAAIELLASKMPKSGRTALDHMLEAARKPSFRIWATYAPYELKDVLKARKYRWNDGSDGFPKAWHIDVDEGLREAEIEFLRAEIYQHEAEIFATRITAYERFSSRI